VLAVCPLAQGLGVLRLQGASDTSVQEVLQWQGREPGLGPRWCPGSELPVSPGVLQVAVAATDQEDFAPPHPMGGLALAAGLAAGRMGTLLLQAVRGPVGLATLVGPEAEAALAGPASSALDEAELRLSAGSLQRPRDFLLPFPEARLGPRVSLCQWLGSWTFGTTRGPDPPFMGATCCSLGH
jgi:hypothetical protein